MTAVGVPSLPPRSFLTNPTLRSIVYQALLCIAVGLLVYAAISNAADNLARARIATGFGFWNTTAGFDISQTLIEYNSRGSTYGRAFWVGLLNTLLVGGWASSWRPCSASRSASRGCRATGWWQRWRPAMSS